MRDDGSMGSVTDRVIILTREKSTLPSMVASLRSVGISRGLRGRSPSPCGWLAGWLAGWLIGYLNLNQGYDE